MSSIDFLSHKRKALIIEDNEMNRELLIEILNEEYEVLSAENGEEGFKLLSENYHELSVVFLDMVMPVCDGYQFLERISGDELLSTVPIIVTTVKDDADSEAKCLELGASDFVSKPYVPQIVLARARSIIKLHESVATLSALEYDKITGVLTMPAFYHYVDTILKSKSGSYDLLVSGIHDFKMINSTYGETVGDSVLRAIAQKFSYNLPEAVLARLQDKFFALYPADNRLTEERLKEIISEIIKESPVSNLPITLGYYKDVDNTQSASSLCDRVLMALAGSKKDITKTLAFYDDAARQKRINNRRMETEFEQALRNGEFVPWFQPKVDPSTGEVVAAEALVRWVGKDGKIIPPGEFIPLFEEDGLIHKLDAYIFDKVCFFQKERKCQGKKVVPVSVNLSRNSVYYKGTIEKYVDMVKKSEVPMELVPIEITESAATESQRIVELAENLVKEGFSLHMDDFGAGYSSLSSLSTIPFDVIKLDKSLVDQIGTDKGEIVLKHIILIAQELGMKVVAEGVEVLSQLEFLRDAGCDFIQGYYFFPPINQEKFAALLD